MKVAKSLNELREELARQRGLGRRIGFVPTMGYLHAGHLSLVGQAREHSDFTVVSIFVNPTQFNDPRDFEAYPIDIAHDSELLEAAGVNLLFLPSAGEIYGDNFQSWITLERLPQQHCGEFRPGHFRGVSTVVSILFNMVQPAVAVFGEKDFQQLRIIEQMVADLKYPITIVRGPTVRESDGLAMSSRNVRLSPQARRAAPAIFSALQSAAKAVYAGERSGELVRRIVQEQLGREPSISVQYISIVSESDLRERSIIEQPARILFAGVLDGVRLIDNIRI